MGLERAVEFWKRVYGEWSQDQVTFHDRDDLGIIYLTIDQKKSETPAAYRANEAAQEAIIDRYRRILLDLATRNPDPRTLSGEYREVYDAFGELGNPARWRQAADRIRVQRGLREHFQRGLIHAGQFREHILAIFREEGVPEEIAWLPMVESTFNIEARSKVGAAGVWQFMPGTGRQYMRVDATVDERLDPIIAARGAARLLKYNYRGLGSWPLALTAYNHGYYGMRRAVQQVGSNDYMTIRRLYDGPAFGFASKNFYAEFLAALHVAEHAEQYFGMHDPFRALEFDVVSMPVADAAARCGELRAGRRRSPLAAEPLPDRRRVVGPPRRSRWLPPAVAAGIWPRGAAPAGLRGGEQGHALGAVVVGHARDREGPHRSAGGHADLDRRALRPVGGRADRAQRSGRSGRYPRGTTAGIVEVTDRRPPAELTTPLRRILLHRYESAPCW